MALGLARDQTSDCSTPVLVFYAIERGFLRDVESLEFQVFDISTPAKRLSPVQVYPLPSPTRQPIDLSPCADAGQRLGLGRYVALYTPDTDEALGDHLIRWYVTFDAGEDEVVFDQEFQVLPAGEVWAPGMYCSTSSLREEGLTMCEADATRVFKAIRKASSFIERVTGRFFYPKHLTMKLNGRGGPMLLLGDPIIAVEAVEVNSFPFDPDPDFVFSNESLRVYNNMGVYSPDDRNNPKIEVFRGARNLQHVDADTAYLSGVTSLHFPEGQQNVVLSGVFGYTDADGSPAGRVPEEIEHVCALLTMRNVVLLSDEERSSQNFAFRITQERTRQQSVSFGSPGGRAQSMIYGYFTGDPEIDAILAAYMRPPALGAA